MNDHLKDGGAPYPEIESTEKDVHMLQKDIQDCSGHARCLCSDHMKGIIMWSGNFELIAVASDSREHATLR